MTQLELANQTEAVVTLYQMGLDPYRIAAAVKSDIHFVRKVLRQSNFVKEFTEPADKELADAMRNLAWRAYEEALDIFEYGSPAEKFGITKAIIARTASMVGQQTTTRYDEMRNELEEIMGKQIRGTEEVLVDPEEMTYDAPELATGFVDFNVDDSD